MAVMCDARVTVELAPQGQQTLETGTVVAAALQWKNFCLHDSYVLGVMRM